MTNASTLRAEAAQHEQDKADSFERCDTDGFLSQWASGCTAALKRVQAGILERDGFCEFPALFDLDGNPIPAKLIDGQYGMSWGIFESWEALNDKGRVIRWVGAFPKRESTLTKKNCTEGRVMAQGWAALSGNNACNVHPRTYRTQFDGTEEVVFTDRFA